MRYSKMFTTIDTHTGGEPTRTITSGIPRIPGATMSEKMLYMQEHLDWIRTALMFEPRGHSVMSGVVITEPAQPEADIGVIFIETGGYLPMCGHDTIGVATALVEAGMVPVTEPVTAICLDTPAGLTHVRVEVVDGRARSVTFQNIPSFVMAMDATVDVEGIGSVTLDVAYGGNVYAIVPARDVGLVISPNHTSQIIDIGRRVRQAVNRELTIVHPEKEFIRGCTHVQFYEPSARPDADFKNAVFLADSGIDRSPCGTGTSARLACLHAKGQLRTGDGFVHESIIGSLFRARVVGETQVGGLPAVIPEVTGSAWVMGINQWVIQPDDPLANGFLLDNET
ncbi:MAG: 4-hydroxyproline epimerase [Thermodesulfobacteriota bacterium]